jgi:hypothetical protein
VSELALYPHPQSEPQLTNSVLGQAATAIDGITNCATSKTNNAHRAWAALSSLIFLTKIINLLRDAPAKKMLATAHEEMTCQNCQVHENSIEIAVSISHGGVSKPF